MIPPNEQVNSYLEQEVLSATPIRLRWMLIRRAEELCSEVERLWSAGEFQEANGWLIRIREIIGELLEGVQDNDNPVNKSVSDFYVFLLKLLNKIEKSRELEGLRSLSGLLRIESETWEQVVKKFSGNALNNPIEDSAAKDLKSSLNDNQTEFQLLKTVDDLLSTTEGLNLEI